MKIINIVHFPAAYNMLTNEEPEVKWETKKKNWCGIWNGNWSQRLGDALLNAGYKIDYEVWRPDLRADKVYSHTFKNGLVYKLFPAIYHKYLWGFRIKRVLFSKVMIDHINSYINENKSIVLHINAGFRYHDKLILDKFHNTVPIVAQFYTNPFNSFIKEKTNTALKYFHRKIISNIVDDYYRKIKFIIPSTQNGLEEIEEKYDIKILYRNGLANFGIDFAVWNKNISKIEARKLLKINKNIFVFFTSSRLIEVKQIDLMINEFIKLKNKKIKLYISGKGEKEYEYFLKKLVKKNNIEDQIKFIGYVSEDTLKKYYIACDTFINCSKSEAGPFSTALAAYYEKPIITTNTGLVYDLLKVHKSGLILNKDDSFQWHKIIASVLNGNKIPVCPKGIVDDYFNWDKISNYYINTYKRVLKNKT